MRKFHTAHMCADACTGSGDETSMTLSLQRPRFCIHGGAVRPITWPFPHPYRFASILKKDQLIMFHVACHLAGQYLSPSCLLSLSRRYVRALNRIANLAEVGCLVIRPRSRSDSLWARMGPRSWLRYRCSRYLHRRAWKLLRIQVLLCCTWSKARAHEDIVRMPRARRPRGWVQDRAHSTFECYPRTL